MRGVILAGGTGTRLLPLTQTHNKHLLPVAGQAMIHYPLRKLQGAGIHEVVIVTGPEHLDQFRSHFSTKRDLGLTLTFAVQDQPGGVAHALGVAEALTGRNPVVVLLGDNLFWAPLGPYIKAFQTQPGGAHIFLSAVSDARRFGVAEIVDDRVTNIEEKPVTPRSNFAVVGVYLFDSTVFSIIRGLTPSSRGEFEITDVNREYLRRGQLAHTHLPGWWVDVGTHETLAHVTDLVRRAPPQFTES